MKDMTRLNQAAMRNAGHYVTECLYRGHALSKKLLDEWDFSQGTVWTTLHPSLGPEASLDFPHGGYLAEARKRGVKEPPELIQEFLRAYLATHRDSVLIIEDEMRRRSDRAVKEIPGRKAYLGDVVYCFLRADEAGPEIIEEAMRKMFAPYLNVMALVSEFRGSDTPKDEDELNENMLQEVAEATRVLIVGAYHEEGHVVWIRNV